MVLMWSSLYQGVNHQSSDEVKEHFTFSRGGYKSNASVNVTDTTIVHGVQPTFFCPQFEPNFKLHFSEFFD